jgi:serine/threonine-protein kinase
VQTNEVGEAQGHYFIAMEYLDGQPLNRLMHRALRMHTQVPMEMYIRILCDALAGLQHAHELTDFDGSALGVVHRDASPHNIFVTYDGQTKVVDFGIAKAATRTAETRAGVLKGKIAYMAPEQARCAEVDRRADVFSIGVVMWELLTGQRLWKGLSDLEILERLMLAEAPRARTLKPDVPPELDAICAKALALAPEQRFQTAAELRDALERFAEANLPRVSHREIGMLVSHLFADKRAELKGIVETQLRSLSRGSEAGVLPIVDPATAGMTPSIGVPRVGAPMIAGDGTPSFVRTPTSTIDPAMLASRRRAPLYVVGAAATIGVVMLVVLLRGGTTQAPADRPGVVEPVSPQSGQAAHPPEPRLVEVTIRANPAEAKLFLDDAPLGQNPFTGKFPADGAIHRLRAEAPGHLTRASIAAFDRDMEIKLELEREATPADPEANASEEKPASTKRPSGSKAPPPAAQPPPADVSKKPGKPPKRKLDTTVPWEQ